MSSAEPSFGTSIDFSGSYVAQKWTAGSEGTPLAAGDIVVAFVVAQANDSGFSGTNVDVEGISTDGTDWVRNVNIAEHDVTTEGYIGVGVWHKVWQVGDDPTGYQVKFNGYDVSGTGSAEVLAAIFVIHGAASTWSFVGDGGPDLAFNAPYDGATYTRAFGDGETWSFTMESGEHPPGSGIIYGYFPLATNFYYLFPGVTIYGALEFGEALPFLSFSGTPDDSNSQTSGDTNPLRAFTFQMWDVLDGAIRISHNVRRARRLSVT